MTIRFRSPADALGAAIALAWLVAVAAQLSGSAAVLHHHALIERGPPLPVAVVLFAAAWQLMIAAMMLPSSLPFFRTYAVITAREPRPAVLLSALVAGYAAVWTLFGVTAFFGDVLLHRAVDNWQWLAERSWLIGGGVLAAAGAFQFTPLKDRCLRVCRVPGTYLLQHYRRGFRGAIGLGWNHGLFCAGCCWALMLLSFAAGFANLWWMAALTALMCYEKIGRYGRSLAPVAGALLLVWGVLIIAHPAWLPVAFGS